MIVTFCGHRDYITQNGDEEKLLLILEKMVGTAPCEFFLGDYGNFDLFAYHCARKFKEKHATARLVFVTPYLPAKEEGRKFDLVIYPPLENVPARFAIAHRNKWMVQQADCLIAYVNRRYGGAYTMYRYALANNKNTYNLAVKSNL